MDQNFPKNQVLGQTSTMERLRSGDPEQIGPWQIVNRLGSGGMGIVYMGTNGTRSAAIKIVRDFLLEDPTSRSRLDREVSTLKKVQSRFVAEIVDSDIDASPAWIATNYVDGPSLKTLVENEGPLPEDKWIELAIGLCSALESIHKAGVIHRDIKPTNILMSATGPRVIDFGISFSSDSTSLTRTGMVAGTPTWFSPEQFQAQPITNAVDIFAAGSTLYFAATGSGPWGKEETSVATTMNHILNKEPNFSKLTDLQKNILTGMMTKDVRKRSTASQVSSGLSLLKNSEKITISKKSEDLIHRNRFGIRRKAVLITLVVLLGLTSTFFFKPFGNVAENKQRPVVKGWSINVSGESAPRKGQGSNFEFFICDQNIDAASLTILGQTKEISPKVKLIRGDSRCGEVFDTLVVNGTAPTDRTTSKLVLAGATNSRVKISYPFVVTSVL